MVQRGVAEKSSCVTESATVVVGLVKLDHRLREVSPGLPGSTHMGQTQTCTHIFRDTRQILHCIYSIYFHIVCLRTKKQSLACCVSLTSLICVLVSPLSRVSPL